MGNPYSKIIGYGDSKEDSFDAFKSAFIFRHNSKKWKDSYMMYSGYPYLLDKEKIYSVSFKTHNNKWKCYCE